MKVYEFKDFRQFITERTKALPSNGRGEYLRMAKHLGLHTTTLSQIVSGTKSLAPEHALSLTEYFGLNAGETRYFLLLVHWDRAGSDKLRSHYAAEIARAQKGFAELIRRVPPDQKLGDEAKAIFYSNWFYTGAWILTSLPATADRARLARYLGLTPKLVNQVIDFLVQSGLCKETVEGLVPQSTYTHLEADSPHLPRHHANWRLKGMERHARLDESEVAYTSPMSISEGDAKRIRAEIVALVESVNRIRDPSPCEAAFCLNIDWIRF